MSLNDQITTMLKKGITQISIGMSPNKVPFVAVVQQLQTGPGGDLTTITHQRENSSVAEAFDKIAKDVEHCGELGSKIIQMPARGSN